MMSYASITPEIYYRWDLLRAEKSDRVVRRRDNNITTNAAQIVIQCASAQNIPLFGDYEGALIDEYMAIIVHALR